MTDTPSSLPPAPQDVAASYSVLDPATLEQVGTAPDHGPAEASLAVDRAAAAFAGWSATPPRERAEVLRRAYHLMIRDRERLSTLICMENGKSQSDALAEVDYAAEFFRWFAEEAVRPGGEFGMAPSGAARTVVSHRPVGVCALVTPWNFPASMATRKIAPALAAGCTAVLKPAVETPLTAFAIAELLTEAGLPDRVLTTVTGLDAPGIVSTWLADSRVRKISFTGSTRVGRLLLRQAAERVVNTSMELGGNAPFVVTADANLEQAVAGAMIAKFRNGGQACTAANRFYVHADVVSDFVASFGAAVSRLRVGRAMDGAEIGPLISSAAVQRISAALDRAVAQGARVVARASTPDLPGHFYPPTVLLDVPARADIVTEETFGPVAPIVVWHDEGQLIEQINDSEYGLAGYVFAGDSGQALRLAELMDVGMVGVNRGMVSDASAPFGGTKQSGLGREGARDGLRAFQEVQYFSVDLAPAG